METAEKRAAFINAQSACAIAEIQGMVAENQKRLALGYSIAYDMDAFMAVQDKYMIGHNAVIAYLGDV